MIDSVICDNREAVKALQNLDIDPADYGNLCDILDPNHYGYIKVLALVDGLKRLRDDPRRSDVIMVDLMVQSVQDKLDRVWHRTRDILEATGHAHLADGFDSVGRSTVFFT